MNNPSRGSGEFAMQAHRWRQNTEGGTAREREGILTVTQRC
jgi:hypothetical protein